MVVKDLSNSFNPCPKNGQRIGKIEKKSEVANIIKKRRKYKKEDR